MLCPPWKPVQGSTLTDPDSSRLHTSGSLQEPCQSSITSVEFHECRAVLAYLSRSECRVKRVRFMLAQGCSIAQPSSAAPGAHTPVCASSCARPIPRVRHESPQSSRIRPFAP